MESDVRVFHRSTLDNWSAVDFFTLVNFLGCYSGAVAVGDRLAYQGSDTASAAAPASGLGEVIDPAYAAFLAPGESVRYVTAEEQLREWSR